MEREKIIETVQALPSETSVKAWVFSIDKKFYHVAEYSAFKMGDKTSIWESNKKGKRTSENPIFHTIGKNHMKCINAFIDSLEEN
jgi:hypothetical protein